MNEFVSKLGNAALVAFAALLFMLPPDSVVAQTVTQQPQFAIPGAVLDLGNGPTEIKMLTGSMGVFTSQSSGVGSTSGSATLLTLTATPLTPPCVGCAITGSGITAGDTVTAYNGGLQVTLSTARTVPASTALAWGAACPAAPARNVAQALVQAGVLGDTPFYTYARVCAAGQTGPGGQFVTFAIGAH